MTKHTTFQTPLEKLQDFYQAVIKLTVNHRVIELPNPDLSFAKPPEGEPETMAYVSPADLAAELTKIDPKWYEPKKESQS